MPESQLTLWYLLCSTESDDAGEAREMTPEQAEDLNGRLAVRREPWRWIQFTDKGLSVSEKKASASVRFDFTEKEEIG